MQSLEHLEKELTQILAEYLSKISNEQCENADVYKALVASRCEEFNVFLKEKMLIILSSISSNTLKEEARARLFSVVSEQAQQIGKALGNATIMLHA